MMNVPTSAAEAGVRDRVTLKDFESSTIMGMQRGVTTSTFLRGKVQHAATFVPE